jgi:DNA-binding PadR family transcriptional regulator
LVNDDHHMKRENIMLAFEHEKLLPTTTTIEFNILVSLLSGNLHGLGLVHEIATRTRNELILVPGTLYTALKRMHDEGWIQIVEPETPQDDRRRYYGLTELGRSIIRQEVERMERVVSTTRQLLNEPVAH